MAKRSGEKRDFMQIARAVVEEAIGEHMDGSPLPEKKPASPKAIAGRMGGNKGGDARANALTAEQRIAIARKAAKKRWSSKKSGRD